MKRLLLLPVLLASCAPPAPAYPSAYVAGPLPEAAGAPTVRLAQAAPQRPARGGRSTEYRGTGDGSSISVRLTERPDGTTRAEGSVSGIGRACAGQFSGTGRFSGPVLVVQDGTVPGCSLTLTRNGRRLTVDEPPACFPLHGANCGLTGELTQR